MIMEALETGAMAWTPEPMPGTMKDDDHPAAAWTPAELWKRTPLGWCVAGR